MTHRFNKSQIPIHQTNEIYIKETTEKSVYYFHVQVIIIDEKNLYLKWQSQPNWP